MPKQNLYILELCEINTSAVDNNKKLKITPIGKVTGIDKRKFFVEGQEILKGLNKSGLKLPLEPNHGYPDPRAAGWFSKFELRKDGIYANLKFNKYGQKLSEDENYKYLSPTYLIDYESREVFYLSGIGFVNQPNLLNEALNTVNANSNSQTKTKETTMPDVNDKQLTKLQNEINSLTEEKSQLSEDNKVLNEQVDKLQKELNEQKIDNAISKGELLPAKKDFALSLDANSLKAFLEQEAKTPVKTDNNIDPDTDNHKTRSDIAKQYHGEDGEE